MFRTWLALCVVFACVGGSASAETPSENLLPNTTKLLISVPRPLEARASFDESQFGKLMADPKMQPFNDDLEKQLEDRQGRLRGRLAITFTDLDGVFSGEVAMGVIQPGGKADAYATALVIDITGHGKEAQALLRTAQGRRLAEGAKAHYHFFGKDKATKGIMFALPAKKGQPAVNSYYFYHGSFLVAVDHEAEAQAIYRRIDGEDNDSLGKLPAFDRSMARVAAQFGESPVDVRWFLEPFGYQRITNQEQLDREGQQRERGRDLLAIYERQGFDAVQGIGGWINFSEGGHELLHRALVYAPAIDRTSKDKEIQRRLAEEKNRTTEPPPAEPFNKYVLAGRMLNFPDGPPREAAAWVPNWVAAQAVFNWKLKSAFSYSETLVNALGDDAQGEMFKEVLDGIRDDKDGPQADVRKNLIGQLGERVTWLSDYTKPITPTTERTVLAFEITGDAKTVTQAVERMMKNDPDHVKHVEGDHVIWELITPPDTPEEDRRMMPDSSVAVAYGHLIRGSHADIVKRVLTMLAHGEELAASKDYKAVNKALDALSDGMEAGRYFERTEKTIYPHWELFKQGKMPVAETMLAGLINRMLGYDAEEEDAKPREPELDGSKLPDFDVARPYLGPGGMFVKTDKEGWLVTGVVLTKE